MTAPEADALTVLRAAHPDPHGEAVDMDIRWRMYGITGDEAAGAAVATVVGKLLDTLDQYADRYGVTFPDPVGAIAAHMPLDRDLVGSIVERIRQDEDDAAAEGWDE